MHGKPFRHRRRIDDHERAKKKMTIEGNCTYIKNNCFPPPTLQRIELGRFLFLESRGKNLSNWYIAYTSYYVHYDIYS